MAIFLIIFFPILNELKEDKAKAKYIFSVSVGYNPETNKILFEDLIDLAPFFEFKNSLSNLKNIFSTPDINTIRIDLLYFELFLKNLSELSSNSSFLEKEKITWKTINQETIYSAIYFNKQIDLDKKKYLELNIEALIDTAKNKTFENIYDLYKINYQKYQIILNDKYKFNNFIEKKKLNEIVKNIVVIVFEFKTFYENLVLKNFIIKLFSLIISHFILFMLYINYRKIFNFYIYKIKLN